MTDETVHHNTKHSMLWVACVFTVAAIVLIILWLVWWRFEVNTDDAYVSGNSVMLTPQVSGIVSSINADDTDFVQKDQILVELDTTDFAIALETNKEMLASEVRHVVQLFEKVDELLAELEIKLADLMRAKLDFEHRDALVDTGGVSKEDYQHALAALEAATGSLSLTEHQFNAALAQVENTTLETHPRVLQAIERVKKAWVDFSRCSLVAPVSGMVAQRKVQVGQSVNALDPLLWVVPLNQLWVNANFKEVQLEKLRIGQPVKMTADIYGDSVVYHGKVVGIGAGTGSVFSVLPPQNATGNWIKIVQRLPVRVSLDPEELKKHPLRLGLSVDVTVDIHHTEGLTIANAKPLEPLYQTDVYQTQEEGVEAFIEEVITANRGSF